MKRLFVFLCVSALVFAMVSPLMAGGIDNKHNFSAEWVRTLNRNAATDSADAVVYNPAGVVKMDDGLYVNLSGQYAFNEYLNTFDGTEYDSTAPNVVPGLFTLFRKDQWAGYFAFTIPCGGGKVDFEDGNATIPSLVAWLNDEARETIGAPIYDADTITNASLEGNSYYYGFTVGGAHALNDMVSVSLGVRYIDASREFEGSATLSPTPTGAFLGLTDATHEVKTEETGDGWGGILGVNISPTDELTIGIRYETKTSLELKTKQKKDTLEAIRPGGAVTDGAKRDRDLPALLGLGVSYNILPDLKADVNFTYYFNDDADWDDNRLTYIQDETKKDNGYDLGIAFEYVFMPQLKASLGYMYTDAGIDPDDISFENPELDAHTIAGGLAYEAMPGLDLNFGILKTFYQEETTSSTAVFPNGVELEKDVIIIALGVQYKFW
jgi:long-chain fatty acid transport protein